MGIDESTQGIMIAMQKNPLQANQEREKNRNSEISLA